MYKKNLPNMVCNVAGGEEIMMMMKGDGTHLVPKKGRRVEDGCLLSYTDRRERVTYLIFPTNLPRGFLRFLAREHAVFHHLL